MNIQRPRLALAALISLWTVTSLEAVDRTQPSLPAETLTSPAPKYLPSYLAALRGTPKCRPVHTPVGDALVTVGKPSVSPLVRRLEGTSKWWLQAECVHLLALIGPEAHHELPALESALEKIRHPIPSNYGRLAVMAIRQDVAGLSQVTKEARGNFRLFAVELLGRMGRRARPALPAIRSFLTDYPEGHPYRAIGTQAIEKIRAASRKTSTSATAGPAQPGAVS